MSTLVNFTTLLTTVTPAHPGYVIIPPFIPSSSIDLSQQLGAAMPDRPLTVRRYHPFTDNPPLRHYGDHPFRSFDSDTRHARRHRGQKLRAAARRKSRERRRLSAEEEEEKKIRRSLNVADPEREKTIQLMKWRRQAFIEVDHHGIVRTTNNSSSIFTMILLMFWCEMSNNCPRPRSFDPTSTTSNAYNWSSHIVLHFKESDRFLCVNERGLVYSQRRNDPRSNVADCIFDHMVITKQYDVYRSVRHPQSMTSCSSETSPSPDPSGPSRVDRLCHGSWYLGVSRNGSVRVVKSTKRLPPPKSFFYQSWVNKQLPRGSSQLPPSHPALHAIANGPFARNIYETTTVKTLSRDRSPSRNKIRSGSRPAFPLLSGVSRRRGDRLATSGTSGLEPLGADCGSNLLSSCRQNRPAKKKRSSMLLRRRRLTSPPPSGTEP